MNHGSDVHRRPRLHWLLAPTLLAGAAVGEETPPPIKVVANPGDSAPGVPSIAEVRQQLSALPASAQVIDPATVAGGHPATVAGLFDHSPGVYAASVGGGEETRISIRGSGLQSDDPLGVVFLLDGLPLNESDGEAVVEDIEFNTIAYGEVFRGAEAMRFGVAALGGAVSLVSRTGRDAGPFAAEFAVGSFASHRESVSGGFAGPTWDGLFAVSDAGSDGYRDHNRESLQKASANIGYLIAPGIENRLALSFARLDRQLPGSIGDDELEENPRQADPAAVPQDFHLAWSHVRAADTVVIANAEQRIELGASWAYRGLEHRDFWATDFNQGITRFASNDLAAAAVYRLRGGGESADRFTVGVLPTTEFQRDQRYQNLNGARGALIADDSTTATNLPLFVEGRGYVDPAHHWGVVAGAQLVWAQRRFTDHFLSDDQGDQSNRGDYHAVNPKLGVMWRPAPEALVFANVGRSFQAPSLDDLVQLQDGTNGGDLWVDLKAQTATTVELGTRIGDEDAGVQLTLYHAWVRNELLALNDALGNDIGTVNASPTRHLGAEFGVDDDLLAHLSQPPAGHHLVLHVDYTFSRFSFVDDPVYGRNLLAGIPVHLLRGEIIYRHPSGFYIGPTVLCSPARFPVDQANTQFVEPYVVFGARLGWRGDHYEVFATAENLGNVAYPADVEPMADARTTLEPEVFEPGVGRSFSVGLAARW